MHWALFPPRLFLGVTLSIVFTVWKAIREIHYWKWVTASSDCGGICCEMFILADNLQNKGQTRFQNTVGKSWNAQGSAALVRHESDGDFCFALGCKVMFTIQTTVEICLRRKGLCLGRGKHKVQNAHLPQQTSQPCLASPGGFTHLLNTFIPNFCPDSWTF